jgi:uncharacterized delta-60 repeat protein
MRTLISVLFLTIYLNSFAQLQIDTSFNHTAYNEFTQLAGNIVNGNKLMYTRQNDLIVAGRWQTSLSQICVWKYLQDGSNDLSFGGNGFGMGYVQVPVPITYVTVTDAKVQNDGKIVVLADAVWSTGNFNATQSFIALARFNSDGTADTTFNHNGLLVSSLAPNSEYETKTLDIDELGTIYIAGAVRDYGNWNCALGTGAWFIASYLPNGSLNTNFNASGFIQTGASSIALNFTSITPYTIPLDLKIVGNNQILLGGLFHPMDSALYFIKYNSNGTYDNSFGSNGIVNLPVNQFPMPGNELTTMYILKDNSFLLLSNNAPYLPGQPDSAVVNMLKITPAGQVDKGFGNNGTQLLTCTANRVRFCEDKYGRLLLHWYNNLTPGTQDVYFFRYFANGQPDKTFGKNGKFGHHPIPNDTYLNGNIAQDIVMNASNTDLSILSLRSATYAPNNTFRIINYVGDTTFKTNVEQLEPKGIILLVSPNPCAEQIQLTCSEEATYSIVAINGALIQTGILTEGTNNIYLPKEIATGTYKLLVAHKKSGTIGTASFIKTN